MIALRFRAPGSEPPAAVRVAPSYTLSFPREMSFYQCFYPSELMEALCNRAVCCIAPRRLAAC